jgi:hypothetical protein
MNKKNHAVRVQNALPAEAAYEVRTRINRHWVTVCDTWAVDGENAEQVAIRIADLLNNELTVSDLILLKKLMDTVLEDGDLMRGFAAVVGTNRRELTKLRNRVSNFSRIKTRDNL